MSKQTIESTANFNEWATREIVGLIEKMPNEVLMKTQRLGGIFYFFEPFSDVRFETKDLKMNNEQKWRWDERLGSDGAMTFFDAPEEPEPIQRFREHLLLHVDFWVQELKDKFYEKSANSEIEAES